MLSVDVLILLLCLCSANAPPLCSFTQLLFHCLFSDTQNNPQYAGGKVDFDMTSPLANDGSNFPCKGYHTDVPGTSTAVATLKAGEQFTVKMEGAIRSACSKSARC